MTKVWIEATREDADLLGVLVGSLYGRRVTVVRRLRDAIREQIPEPPKWHFTQRVNNTYGEVANIYRGDELKGVLYGADTACGAQRLVDSLNAQAES